MATKTGSRPPSPVRQSLLAYCAGAARLEPARFQREYEHGHAARLLELLSAVPKPDGAAGETRSERR